MGNQAKNTMREESVARQRKIREEGKESTEPSGPAPRRVVWTASAPREAASFLLYLDQPR